MTEPNIRVYLAVFGVLMALTVATVLVSYWHLSPAPAILIGVTIAALKAGLVAAFFMHLKGERALIYGILGMTLFFLILLFVWPIADTAATGKKIGMITLEEGHVP